MEQILVSRREAAAALGICLRTVDVLIADGTLLSRKIRKRRLIPREAVERLASPSPQTQVARTPGGRPCAKNERAARQTRPGRESS